MTDRATLLSLLERYAARAAQAPLSLGEVSDELGGSAFSALCVLLSLPFLTPVSLGPLAIAGGLTLSMLGMQLLRGAPAPLLPGRVRAIELPPATWRVLLVTLERIVSACGRFSYPRQQRWVEGAHGVRLRGWVITVAALLMALPLFGMPFNNALPALAIVMACLAEFEDDGVLALLAVATTLISAVYILGVLSLVAIFGIDVISNLL